MRLSPFLDPATVLLIPGTVSRDSVLERISTAIAGESSAVKDAVLQAFLEREKLGPTHTPQGTAFPHAVTAELSNTKLVIVKADKIDDPSWPNVDLVFAVAGPESTKWEHLKLFARLYRFSCTPAFLSNIRQADSSQDLLQRIQDEDGRHV